MDAVDIVHFIFFQVLPYVVIVVVLLGSLARFVVAPYSWKSQSSQLLVKKPVFNAGFVLFHIGVILLFFGHLMGLFVPQAVFDTFGIGPAEVQLMEITIGGTACVIALIGIVILFIRRAGNQRIRSITRVSDWLAEILIISVITVGGICVLVAIQTDRSGAKLVEISEWAIGVVTCDPTAWVHMLYQPLVIKLHIFIGLMVFFCVPFTRLIHIWSGYLSPIYLVRPHQQMRAGASRFNDVAFDRETPAAAPAPAHAHAHDASPR